MEYNTVSIKQIIDRVKRHPMMEDMSEEYIIDYAVDFLRIMGIPSTFDEKFVELDLDNYRAKLPDDFMEIISVRSLPNDEGFERHCYKPVYYREATGIFHMSDNKYNREPFVYKMQGNIIYTSTKKGRIEVAYRAMPVDECGFPLIPDNSIFLRAIESYIKVQYFTILFDQGKLQPQILNQAQQDYSWNVGGVAAESHKLNPDKLESIVNNVKAMIIRQNEHYSGYAHSGRDTKMMIH